MAEDLRQLLDEFRDACYALRYEDKSLAEARERRRQAYKALQPLERRVAALLDAGRFRFLRGRHGELYERVDPHGAARVELIEPADAEALAASAALVPAPAPAEHVVCMCDLCCAGRGERLLARGLARQPSDEEIDEAAHFAADKDAIAGYAGTPRAHVIAPHAIEVGERPGRPGVEVGRGSVGNGDGDEDEADLAAAASGARPA